MDARPVQLGAELRRLRHQLGLTQRQVAERLGDHVRERDVHRIEAGHLGMLSPQQLQTLLLIYGKDMQAFLTDFGYEPSGGVTRRDRSTPPVLEQARTRLQIAMQSSQTAYQLTKELMLASDHLAVQGTLRDRIETPSAGSTTNAS